MARLLRLFLRGWRKVIREPVESILILRMAGWVTALSLLVKLRPLPRALEIVTKPVQGPTPEAPDEIINRLARAMDILLRADILIFKPICWKRAAVLNRYLAAHGIASRIVFGIRRGPKGEVDGHAWLEYAGKPILEATAPNYKVTYAFPSRDPFDMDLSSISSPSLKTETANSR